MLKLNVSCLKRGSIFYIARALGYHKKKELRGYEANKN